MNLRLKNFNYFILLKIITSIALYLFTYFNHKNVNIIFMVIYIIMGYDVLIKSIKSIILWDFFDENFLMSFATLGAILINEYHEAASVMMLYQIGEYLREISVSKSKKSISDLLDLRNKKYSIIFDNQTTMVDYKNIVENDII
ncbi:hypothetical protein ABGF25_06905, partial [Helcococcus ovis]